MVEVYCIMDACCLAIIGAASKEQVTAVSGVMVRLASNGILVTIKIHEDWPVVMVKPSL